jgi:hypothetical protein
MGITVNCGIAGMEAGWPTNHCLSGSAPRRFKKSGIEDAKGGLNAE